MKFGLRPFEFYLLKGDGIFFRLISEGEPAAVKPFANLVATYTSVSCSGKYIGAHRCQDTLYMEKKFSNSKKARKIISFLGIKDDHVLYSYKNISPWNDFHCFLGQKRKT